MPITISITGASPEEALKNVQDFLKPKDESVEDLLARVRSMLAGQGMTVTVVEAKPNGGAEPAAKEEPVDLDESVVETKKRRGGQPKLSKEEAAAALAEEGDAAKQRKAALASETPAARKTRCVAKLQELFAAGRKGEVRDILLQHGDGAKSFHAVPEENFKPISEALEQLEA
jgi:hypothetical protein